MAGGSVHRRFWFAAVALVVVFALAAPALAKDKAKDNEKKDEAAAAAASPAIARINGEDVTKIDFEAILKANQRFYDVTSQSVRDRLRGRPLQDLLFGEEVVKIRSVAQKYADVLPQMKATIDQAQAKLKGGADFAEVAKEFGQDATAQKGGSLGEEPQGFFDFVPPFNHVALSLKQGQVSEPILTIFGYHIIRVDKIIPPMEMKPKRVILRHILVRYPPSGTDPRKEAEEAAKGAKVEIVDPAYCKKLPSYCGEGS